MTTEDNKIYGEIIGCDSVHYAMVTSDTNESYLADAPEFLAPVAEIAFDYAESLTPRYYDNVAYFMDVSDDDSKISIIFSGIPNEKAAKLLGLPYDSETGRVIETTPNAPWVAISCRTAIAGGSYMYYQYLKGKFTRNSKKANSKGGANVTYNTTDLVFTAAKTIHKFQLPDGRVDGVRGMTGATTDEKFTTADTWFNKVQIPNEPTAAQTAQTAQTEEPQE